jgi:hypothetical protein
MSARFPDSRTIQAALLLATRAPSIHNSQPWRWKVGEQTLHLHADPGRHLPNTDPDSRDLLLSCGASLHHAVVGLAAMGWHAKVHRLPDELHPEHLATIEVSRHPADELDIKLAAAIPRRRTDRRHYAWWPVPAADVALIANRAAGAEVMLRRVASLPKLQEIVARAVWQHATDRDYLTELTAWTGRYASVAGVPARNIPKSDPTSPIPGRLFAGEALEQPLTPKQPMTAPWCWPSARRTTAAWRGCAPAKPRAWSRRGWTALHWSSRWARRIWIMHRPYGA